MKLFRLQISMLFFLCNPFLILSAQNFWEQMPFPDTVHATCAAVNSQNVIFAGTQTADFHHEGVYRSTDQGATWEMVLSTNSFPIHDIAINSSDHIYAATGGFDPLRVSMDNGETWQSVPFDYNIPVGKIYCKGTDTIFIGSCTSSSQGMLIRSYDSGLTWDTVFIHEEGCHEAISGFALLPSGEMYVSMMAFYPGMGGLYKSVDNGITWELAGLHGAQIECITANEAGDLFIGLFDSFEPIESFIYAIYHDDPALIACPFPGSSTNTLKINSSGDIYAGCCAWQAGLGLSLNNGDTFNLVYTNHNYELRLLAFDNQDFLYAVPNGTTGLSFLRSSQSTITQINKPHISSSRISIFPNPASGKVTIGNLNSLNKVTGISVYDIQCKLQINKQVCNQDNLELDISTLKAGIYFLEIKTAEDQEFHKLVIR